MNNNRTDCALPRRTKVLVIPTAIPKPCLSGKQVGIPVRVVVHNQQDLALEINVFIVIPVVFGCLDAIADEDDLGIGNLSPFFLHTTADDELIPLLQRHGFAMTFESP